MSGDGPVRTCVVCREHDSPDDLVRLVLDPDGRPVVDFRGKLPGRGAWAHDTCLPALEAKPGSLARSFHQPVERGPWVEQYRSALSRALRDGLTMASASGALIGGQDALVASLSAREIEEVALASDCAERTERHLRAAAAEHTPFTRLEWSAADLGAVVGRGPRAAVGVRRSTSSAHLLRQLRRLRRLG